MASWRNTKWDGNETFNEFSYRVTQLEKALGLNDQHILDTFKLGLPSNIYVNLVHIDGMQPILNMAKRLIAVSKGTSPGAIAISNVPFMTASSHDGLTSGIYQKPDISKQVTFQDSALLSGLQKINKKLKSLDNSLYALRAERNERSRREYKSPGRQKFRNRNRSRDKSRGSQVEIEGFQEGLIGLEINLEIIQVIDQMIEQEMVEMILNKNPTDIVNIVIKMVILGNTVGRCKPMLRKHKGLRRWMIEMITHQDIINSMVSEDPVSDDDLDGFIRNCSEMTELN